MTLLSELRKNQDAAIGADGLDSAEVTTIAQSAGLSVYTALDSLPSTGLTSGDQAWVESSGRLYISNGSGWYNVALINASPTLTLDQSGTIELNGDTLTVTVTASASDSDDNQDIISFSVESDGNMVGTGTSVSQDSSVFTITALSADSGGVAGDFTLTFKATDQIAVDNEALSFSLSFTNVVDSSAETIFLMKADGNGANNSAITYQNSSDTSTGFTEAGTPHATTFTPHRSGGYSIYFGAAGDRIYTGSSSDFDLDTNDWCYEGWFYVPTSHSFVSYPRLMGLGAYYNTAQSFGVIPDDNDHSDYITVYWGDGGSNASRKLISSTTWDKEQWNHVAVVRKGGAIALYYNGTRIANNASYGASTDIGSGNTYAYIGHTGNGTEGTQMYFRDVRLVNGSSIYDPADTTITVPTEALTAVTNTKLLVGGTPYIADISSSTHALTLSGVDGTYPFGPYDYEPWAADDHGGSVYFDGSGDYLTAADDTSLDMGTGDFTVECWIYLDGDDGSYNILSHAASGGMWLGKYSAGFVWRKYGVADVVTATAAPSTGEWHHIAVVRSSSNTKMYIDGTQTGSTASDTANYSVSASLYIGDDGGANSQYFNGYIHGLRIVKGSAVYTSDFTPPTAPLSHITNTSLLMNNKSDANIYDASATTRIQLYSPTSSTTQRKFNTSSSIVFDGDDEIVSRPDNDIVLSSSDFTVEFWFYQSSTPGTGDSIFEICPTTTRFGPLLFYYYNAEWLLYSSSNGSTWGVTQGFSVISSPNNSQWYHVAIAREGNNMRVFVDGTQVGSTISTSGVTYSANCSLRIGYGYRTENGGNGSYFNGYLQDFRLTKGHARYTANFTAPTAEFEL